MQVFIPKTTFYRLATKCAIVSHRLILKKSIFTTVYYKHKRTVNTIPFYNEIHNIRLNVLNNRQVDTSRRALAGSAILAKAEFMEKLEGSWEILETQKNKYLK